MNYLEDQLKKKDGYRIDSLLNTKKQETTDAGNFRKVTILQDVDSIIKKTMQGMDGF
ncbi:MAG: hypothetical protein ACREBI_06880 [Nitrosotalea sp.]